MPSLAKKRSVNLLLQITEHGAVRAEGQSMVRCQTPPECGLRTQPSAHLSITEQLMRHKSRAEQLLPYTVGLGGEKSVDQMAVSVHEPVPLMERTEF